ncbi:DUF2683 family protein [Dyadobacter sp. CY356]|uniref:DUF2683 family protein n=1 Tax=Dyadobacter sp. CY356 TaxID=2906442 RepID=UPI001F239428|nr:DUF2683 family protein [Dyadobacter sp. CY356]MCF0059178.1 hypothetical protein [Dyadobacter sp. CY356]
METLVITTKGGKLKALKAFLVALEIPFQDESLNSHGQEEFVANIQAAEEDIKAGRIMTVKGKKELHSMLDSL